MNKENQGSENFKEYMDNTVKCRSSTMTRQCQEEEEISNDETVASEEEWSRAEESGQVGILYV